MGYTRYWNRTDKQINDEFIWFVNDVIIDCKSKGIRLRDGWGEGEPVVSTDGIFLNGDSDKNLDHETFAIDEEVGFNFCKTARKPYDYAVRTILEEAEKQGYVTNVRSDGQNNDIISDVDYFKVRPSRD